ncbi:MAG: MarR family transcriptional regulator [Actinobacteria bacterium]|nr:MarR family transcriptional regulator [Actinomycetota bacterium]MBV8396389.1 MarR family transcriptional regulator [Actinomycetota bacterium]MBV8597536.1 MarR family transcriptional regulator [Actinomycetota bacterium]
MVYEPAGRHVVFTGRAVQEAFAAVMTEAGGSLATWVVLSALSDVGIVSQAELASHVHLEGATITHHIDRLEAAGLVERKADPKDRRVRRLELTPAGEELHTRLLDAAAAFNSKLNEGLSERDLATLRRILARMQANLSGD